MVPLQFLAALSSLDQYFQVLELAKAEADFTSGPLGTCTGLGTSISAEQEGTKHRWREQGEKLCPLGLVLQALGARTQIWAQDLDQFELCDLRQVTSFSCEPHFYPLKYEIPSP